MRVVHVVPYFHSAWAYGGIPRLAWGLARALDAAGCSVSVITTDALDHGGRLPAGRAVLDGIATWRIPNASNRLAYHHQLFLPLARPASWRAALADADVVHLHGWWHLLGHAAALAAPSTPMVCTPNGTLPALERKLGVKRAWDLALGAPLRRHVARWIAVSRAELSQFAVAALPRERCHLVHNGIDLAEFAPPPARGGFRARWRLGDGPVVLYLGKLTPRKGVDHLLRAVARLRGRGIRLVVAGNDMGVLAGLRALQADLGLHDVLWTGLLTGEDRLAALADADVLVYASSDEIFGLVPFEGLLAGTPAVVSDDCGCGELVAQARAGELVRYGDPEALAAALARLLDDPDRRRRMVARGRDFVQRHFDWPTIAARTMAVYEAASRDPER